MRIKRLDHSLPNMFSERKEHNTKPTLKSNAETHRPMKYVLRLHFPVSRRHIYVHSKQPRASQAERAGGGGVVLFVSFGF